ncbi:MAG: carbon-nitrogen hydrolase family protein [Alphaproteobacteria bacterium]|nr:carbon-nitrogen hydrolase family protein [Alphaproteobacteria bacterium]
MTMRLMAACVQMTSGPDIAANLANAAGLVREAAGQGARLVCTPENTDVMRADMLGTLALVPAEEDHPALPFFAELARELGVFLSLGSIGVRVASDKIANRSYLFDDKGALVARYDKIHLFDVDLPTGESRRESAAVRPGGKAVIAPTPWGGVGMSVCYDLRFAYLYRALTQAGARILTVPAAFTVPTGQAHWEVLLRARAIETGSFVLAAAQCGIHEGGRETYGHSLIIGPWGEVLAQGQEVPGVIMAALDLSAVDKARRAIPVLSHDRAIGLASSG